MCYDCKDIQTRSLVSGCGTLSSTSSSTILMASIQATRLRKGMLIKMGLDLFKILDLHHLTPGNKRGMVQARLRNIRSQALSDHKFRSEDDVERATLDEREMQYLYADGSSYHFMDTSSYEQIHIDSDVLGDSVNYLIADMSIRVEFYGTEPVGHRAAADRRSPGGGHGAWHQGGDGERTGQTRPPGDRPGRAGASLRQPRRSDSSEYGDRGISVTSLSQSRTRGQKS